MLPHTQLREFWHVSKRAHSWLFYCASIAEKDYGGEMDKLLRCPFCGGQADIFVNYIGQSGVACKVCCASISVCDEEKYAIANWNKRMKEVGGWYCVPLPKLRENYEEK